MTRASQKSVFWLLVVVLLVGLWWWTSTGGAEPQGPDTGLRTVEVGELPPEARETIERIERGGPFPYEQDGATFQNREGLLPDHDRGYYREYTVPTPGEDDRGARRIVTGGDTMYWTADHYSSFARIVGVD